MSILILPFLNLVSSFLPVLDQVSSLILRNSRIMDDGDQVNAFPVHLFVPSPHALSICHRSASFADSFLSAATLRGVETIGIL